MGVTSVDGLSDTGSLPGSYKLSSLPQPAMQDVPASTEQNPPTIHVLPEPEIPGVIHGMISCRETPTLSLIA